MLLKLSLKFARPQIILTMAFLVVLGSLISGGLNLKTLIAFVIVSVAIIHANSINDYSDRQIDEVNLQGAKDRPFVTGELSDRGFWLLNTVSAIVALLLSLVFGYQAVIFSIAIIIFDYVYSLKPIRLTDRTLVSPLLLAACYTYYPLSLGYWSNVHSQYPWLLSSAIYLAFLARMLLKDFRDVEGDERFGKITFLVRYGAKATCLVSASLWAFAFLIALFALDFSPGVLVTLPLGLLHVSWLLNLLWLTKDKAIQQRIINFIANAANSSILAIFLSLLVQNLSGINSFQKVLIPAVLAGGLIIVNFVKFLMQRSQLAVKMQAKPVSAS